MLKLMGSSLQVPGVNRFTLALALIAWVAPAVHAHAQTTSQWRDRVRREVAALKEPAKPPGQGNPVDAFLDVWWKMQGVAPRPLCDDRMFLRRAHLDLIGLLPDESELAAFVADRRSDKRARLVGELLARRQPFSEHWMTFWNDLLRNDEVALIQVNRRAITQWLYNALLENKPYDQFAAELIAPAINGPVGFIQGMEWKFAVSASEVSPMQAARSVAQVFQGVNLKCASCHDSFTGERKLDEAWSLAACFAEAPLESQRCDKPTGRVAAPRFLFAEVGQVPADAPLEMRREAVAVLVTRPNNPRFAKVIVNRLFRQLFGQGIVEQVDDLDGDAGFHPELLDFLAYDLIKHNYDLKRTLRLLATSQAYGRIGGWPGLEPSLHSAKPQITRGEVPVKREVTLLRQKRMTAEQFSDALATLTGFWPQPTLMKAELEAGPVRAWRYRDPDALATAMGRPSRDVINSTRPEAATILQSLELINGAVLQERLTKGAERLLAGPLGKEPDIDKVIHALCRRAYSRDATATEIEQGHALLGTAQQRPAQRRAGWEDFLWLIVMRSEFQYY